MPSVPRLTNQIRQAPIQIATRESTPNGLQQIGGGIQNVTGELYEIKQRETLLADQAAVTEADRLLGQTENALLYDPQNGALNKQGKSALGIAPTVLTEFDAQTSKIEQGLTSDRSKRVFREAQGKRRLDIERDLSRHEVQQREVYADNEAQAYVKESINTAANHWGDPERSTQELQRQRAVIEQQATRKGWSPAQRDETLRAAQSDTHTAILSRMIGAQQTDKAAEYLGKVREQLDSGTIAKAEQSIAAARIDQTANRIIGVFAQDGPDAGSAQLERLAKSGLSQDQLGDIYSKVQTGTSQIRAQRQQLYAKDLSAIYDEMATNQASENTAARVDALWNRGALSPIEYASLHGRVEESRLQGAVANATAAEIRAAMESGIPLDPSNAAQRKALDSAFAQDVSQVKPGSAPWLQAASAYAARTRMLPSQASAWARASLRSPNPSVAGPAAQFVAGIEASAGDAISSFDTDTKAMAGVVNSMIAAGTPADKAVEMARETVFNRKPAITEQRKTEYRTFKDSDSALDNLIDKDFDTLFSSQPQATAGLKTDFRSQVEQYYLSTGDIKLARDLAWTDLKRVYGVSEVNGTKQMMALPPERFGVKVDDIRSELSAFLQGNPQADASVADDIILVPDALTLRSVHTLMDGKPVSPSYKLITKSGDLVTDSKGVPIRYTLPSGEVLEQKLKDAQAKAAAEAKQKIDFARRDREERRQRQEQLNRGELR